MGSTITLRGLALSGVLMASSAAIGASPQVVFAEGDGARFVLGKTIRIERGGLQLRLGQETLLDAGAGAEFLLEEDPAKGLQLLVVAGSPLVIDTGRNTVRTIPPGRYAFDEDRMAATIASDDDIASLPLHQPELMLAEIVLTQEIEYLKRIQLNPIDLARGIFNLVRGIFGKR